MYRAIAGFAAASSLVAGIALAGPSQAITPQLITGPYVSGWFGYWEPDSVVEALAAQGTSTVPEVNLFWWSFASADRPLCTYNTDSSCSTTGETPWTNDHLDGQRRILQSAGIPVLGSIVDGSKARTLSDYLADESRRNAYANQIVDWTVKAGLDGVDLDWEKFAFADGKETWEATKPRWVAFIKTLAPKLRDQGLLLSATVPAGTYPFLADGRPNPGTGYPVYAWAEIIDHVDRLRLMAYDYSYDSPGPIGPWPWANEVVSSAIDQVATAKPANRNKIWLGIPQYSRNWVRQNRDGSYVTGGECPAGWAPAAGAAGVPGMLSQSIERAQQIAAREQVTPTWDATYGEYTFRYWIVTDGAAGGVAVQCDAEREVWFADTRSAKLKANIVSNQRIAGVAVWEFGFVLDGFYSQMARKIAPPLELRVNFDSKIRKGESTKVYGKVLRGDDGVFGAKVTVTWISSTSKKKNLGATRTDTKGKYALKVTPPRSGTLRITATSEGQKVIVKRPITVTR
ncbi:MAG: glycosyl hydrolase family 18 protein [Candidatus Nanopelagicales bacterium]